MNVLLVSQCNKRALTETRRILDQFAERRGERTWQTAITQAGLDTLRKLLRKTARKNTAVACHWIRGKNHSELLWVVGDASQFNPEGTVPTNITHRNVLRHQDENNWHSLHLINQITALAALLHDLGKASQAFQNRLTPSAPIQKNRYRHEWVSVRLFQAFVGTDDDAAWLHRLADAADDDTDEHAFERAWMQSGRLLRDGLDNAADTNKPFSVNGAGLPPLAQAVAWLVLTHHRLPAMPPDMDEQTDGALWYGRKPQTYTGADLLAVLGKIDSDWNEPWRPDPDLHPEKTIGPYWTFPHGLPVRTLSWRKRAARIANSMLKEGYAGRHCLNDSFVMHIARLALMVCDHHYSSLKDQAVRVQGEPDYPLFANTDRVTGLGLQRLDEHLLGVERHVGQLVHTLPDIKSHLSHLVGHRGLKRRTSNTLFRWQDRAADLAAGVRRRASMQGAFIVNMASTGCGKTLGNARIMNALAEPSEGLRCAFAIGLRTLTLQTGRSYQNDLGLGDDELAIQVGGAANKDLFEYYEQKFEQSGSASRQALVDDVTHVIYEANDHHPALQKLGTDSNMHKLLAAPLLVCTIDHLVPATESLRGGRQIVPMLRLMTGDLVLDEPDDFDLSDLPTLTRLVHWAGLLGSRVLLSSATLPPALVKGLFSAYLKGREQYQRNRSLRHGDIFEVCCLWVDEFIQSHADCASVADYAQQHENFARSRNERLAKQPARRRANVLALPDLRNQSRGQRRETLALAMRDAALELHQKHHETDPHSGKRVSFGLIRMANINPLVDVALALFAHGAPSGMHIHLCVYHSQFPLFMRSEIEYRLDTTLNRRNKDAVFDMPEVRRLIDSCGQADQLFIVLGSPVTEVGRDHDYDWSVVEPSSMRSLIQLAGRVRRHRPGQDVEKPNITICQRNLRSMDYPGRPAYWRPGFESYDMPLASHRMDTLLASLLDKHMQMPVDARPRILPRNKEEWQPTKSLVDLEHVRMEAQVLPPEETAAPVRRTRLSRNVPARSASVRLNASSFWQREHASLVGFLQQVQPFREQTAPDVEVVLVPDEEGDNYRLFGISKERYVRNPYIPIEESLNHRIPDDQVSGTGISPWGRADVMQMMVEQAEDRDLPLEIFAKKYARLTLPESTQGWRWHPLLGFSKAD